MTDTPTSPPAPAADDYADFARIRRPGRSPLVAGIALALGTLLLVHSVDDTLYALRGGDPVDLGDARAIDFATAPLSNNTLVAVRGLPDYRNALLFEPKGDSYRRAFFRLLGTDSRLWVRAEQTSARAETTDRVVGRLKRFYTLPYAEQVRAYYRDDVRVTRPLDLDPLRAAMTAAGPPGAVADRAGGTVDLAAQKSPGVVVVQVPGELEVSLGKDKFPVEEDARHELKRLGAPVGPYRETEKEFIFAVRVDISSGMPVRDAYLGKLEAAGFRFALRRVEIDARLADLRPGAAEGTLSVAPIASAEPSGLLDLAGDALAPHPAAARVEVPWSHVDTIAAVESIDMPASAWLVTEAELPGDYAWTLVLDGVLVIFLGFNAWLLARSLKAR